MMVVWVRVVVKATEVIAGDKIDGDADVYLWIS